MASPKYYGKYRAQVVDVSDPEMRGRIRVMCPKVLGEAKSSWCETCVQVAGDNEGDFSLPAVGESVWIEFEEGNPNRPILTGGWYSTSKSPLGSNYGDPSSVRIISFKGSTIFMTASSVAIKNNDSSVILSSGKLTLGLGGAVVFPVAEPQYKTKITFTQDSITLSTQEDKTQVVVESSGIKLKTDDEKVVVNLTPEGVETSINSGEVKSKVSPDEVSIDYKGESKVKVNDSGIELNKQDQTVLSLTDSSVNIKAENQTLNLNGSNIQKLNNLL